MRRSVVAWCAPSLADLRSKILRIGSTRLPLAAQPPTAQGTNVVESADPKRFFADLVSECDIQTNSSDPPSAVLIARADALKALSTADDTTNEGVAQHGRRLASVIRDSAPLKLVTNAAAESLRRRELRVLPVVEWRLQLPPDEELEAESGISGRIKPKGRPLRGVRSFLTDVVLAETTTTSRRAASITAIHQQLLNSKMAPESWLWVCVLREGITLLQALQKVEARTGIKAGSWRWRDELDAAANSVQWCLLDCDDPNLSKLCDANGRDGVFVQAGKLAPKSLGDPFAAYATEWDAVHYHCLIRNVTAPPHAITANVRKSLHETGFLNFFGPRRFGLGKVKLYHVHELLTKSRRLECLIALMQFEIDRSSELQSAYINYVRTGTSAVFGPWPWVRALVDLVATGEKRDSAYRSIYHDLVPRMLQHAVSTSIPHVVWNIALSCHAHRRKSNSIESLGYNVAWLPEPLAKVELHSYPLRTGTVDKESLPHKADASVGVLPLIPWITKDPNDPLVMSSDTMLAFNVCGFHRNAWSNVRGETPEEVAGGVPIARPAVVKPLHANLIHFAESGASRRGEQCRLQTDAELSRVAGVEPKRKSIKERCSNIPPKPTADTQQQTGKGSSRDVGSSVVIVDMVLPKGAYLSSALREWLTFDRPELRRVPTLKPLNLAGLLEQESTAPPLAIESRSGGQLTTAELDEQLESAGRLFGVDPDAVAGNVMDLKVRNVSIKQAVLRGFVSDDSSAGRIIPRDIRRPSSSPPSRE